MFRTRLWMGSLLVALTLGLLVLDDWAAPWFPFLFLFVTLLAHLGCHELRGLFPPERRPAGGICHGMLQLVVTANWIRPMHDLAPRLVPWHDPWHLIIGMTAGAFLLAFLYEMTVFSGPGEAVSRVALLLFTVIYLGVLPSFLLQLRWLGAAEARPQAVHALMLTIFVPKCCDIGAYCTGKLIGRHKMTPLLSPKKTWEGAAGGLTAAVLTAIGVSLYGNRPAYYLLKAGAFGLAVGGLSMLGDLAESLIKREGHKKDASTAVPGFGGVLDVVDSVMFSAPLSFVWLTTMRLSPLG